MNGEEALKLYEKLYETKQKWMQKDYSNSTQQHQMEFKRDNDLQFIEELMRKYNLNGNFTEGEINFANRLIRSAYSI